VFSTSGEPAGAPTRTPSVESDGPNRQGFSPATDVPLFRTFANAGTSLMLFRSLAASNFPALRYKATTYWVLRQESAAALAAAAAAPAGAVARRRVP
jgi:hypothetical protein